ncbi:unnamed protein product [Lactuca saligna]|uniref:Arabidopsis retrotransposon Orf1 C-terminal domain-containing protein n=1 Tax=Lactuca saligna TaxID=75948 RepID=A0AA35VPP3_LACSI|nr:unnamed protein product [Lactuca saligna]
MKPPPFFSIFHPLQTPPKFRSDLWPEFPAPPPPTTTYFRVFRPTPATIAESEHGRAKTGTGETSSKGGSKGKSKDPLFRLLNREDRKTYDFLVSNKRQVKSTKFLHRESFVSLGVLDGVQALFNNIGWGQFFHNRAATYVEPTLEFLTTFNPEEEAQTVTFQMLGEKRSLPHRVVNALMGTPVDNLYYQQDPWTGNFNEHYFWQQITNEPQY